VKVLSDAAPRAWEGTKRRSGLACLFVGLTLVFGACDLVPGGRQPENAHTPRLFPEPAPTDELGGGGSRSVTIAAAGDISEAEIGSQEETSDLIVEEDPDYVLTLGDNQYENGSLEDYEDYYDPTWGRFKDITFPAPGNHDKYDSGYEEYFDSPDAWYSFDLGRWHLVSLDSNRPEHNSQISFLEEDLASDGHLCQLAFWHHARWSSGSDHGSDGDIHPLWERVVAAGFDLVLVSHEHTYERFDPLDVAGRPTRDGTYQIIVGTGGAEQHDDFFDDPLPGSETRLEQTHGVLFLELNQTSFSGEFKTPDGTVLDRFEGDCR
jgi:hypothetical protein